MDWDMIRNPNKYFSNAKTGYSLEDNIAFEKVRNTLVKYGMPTELFDTNLKSLEMKKDSASSVVPGNTFGEVLGAYDPKKNQIIEPSNPKDLIHEVFHMASNRVDGTKNMGVLNEEFGISLNEGITDMFSTFSTYDEDDKYEIRYPVEELFAFSLGKLYGIDIFKHFFSNDYKGFMNSFGEDREKVISLVGELDKVTRASNNFINRSSLSMNEMASAFVNVFSGFIDLANSKNSEFGKSYFESIKEMLSLEIDSVRAFRSMIEMSEFGNIENVISVIEERCHLKEIKGFKM